METLKVIAACSGCGRGYVYVQEEGVRCHGCEGGTVWSLPASESNRGDHPDDKARRKQLVLEVMRRKLLRINDRRAKAESASTEQSGSDLRER